MSEARGLGIAGGLTRAFIGSALVPLFILAAIAAGLVALISLPREEEPQISVPMIDIMVEAPGLRAEDALRLVTEPLEMIVKAIGDVEHVYSQTSDDAVMVTARFRTGTDADDAILRVHQRLRANMDRIPEGIAEPLVIGRGIDDVAVLTLTLSAKPGADLDAAELDTAGLSRIARALRAEVAALPDVGTTWLVGEAEEAFRITPDPDLLALHGVTLAQLAERLRGANRVVNTGFLRDGGEMVALIAGTTLQSPAEVEELTLMTRDGREIFVSDVAKVQFVPDTADRRMAFFTRDSAGRIQSGPAVTLAVAKRAGANAVMVTEAILARMAALEGGLIPEDLQLSVTRDYGHSAAEKADELLFHLGLATLSIVALVWLAVGWRAALVVALVIPVTILLTLLSAWLMGYTLNRVSLFALIFSIGILVDDAIVVIENIARHWGMRDGRSRREAAIEAVAEVGNPTIIATLTVVAALLPMLFVSGMMGPYMSPIPANASAAMVFSFFVAVIVTPWLMLKLAGGAAPGHGAEDEGGGRLGRAYARIARPLLATRRRALGFLVLAAALSFGALGAFATRDVTVKLLPFDNKPELSVMIDLAEGASVEATDRLARNIAEDLLALPEVQSVRSHAALAAPFDFNGLVRHSFLREAPWQGEVSVVLVPKSERARGSHEIALQIRERILALPRPEGTVLRVVEPPPGPPVMATLLAEVYGPSPEARRAAAEKLRAAFESVDFITDVDDGFGVPPRRLRARIVPDRLEFFGVAEADVLAALALLNGGETLGYSHRGQGRLPIPLRLELPIAERVMGERLLATPIPALKSPGGRGVVELGDVLEITEERASWPIFRRNGRAAEMVQAELAGAYEAPLYAMLAVTEALDAMEWRAGEKPLIALHGQPQDESGITLLWEGEWEVTWVTFRDMGAAFAVALLAIYILVVAQFGSFLLPLVVLTPIPLTFLGIIFGHWLFAAPFSATSMIGFIALAGIIVRNSILLVDFIRHAQPEGQGGAGQRRVGVDLLIEAGATRFRPILLTALAAMIGAAVILTDPIFQGLAISLLFGLLSSTLLTVLVIPAIWRVFRSAS